MGDSSRVSPLFDTLVLIRGAGSLGSGVAFRLVKAGFPVVMTELPLPLLLHTTVSYGAAVLSDTVIVEGITARRSTLENSAALFGQGIIPVIVDPSRKTFEALKPAVIVDARNSETNIDTTIKDAPLVIALGSGFTAGADCHVVIEIQHGHNLGRVYWQGGTQNTKRNDYVLLSPADGPVRQYARIGEHVKAGTVIAFIGATAFCAPFDGLIRGLIDDNVVVASGSKIAELDPLAEREECFTISGQSLAIGGAVVEAVLSAPQIRKYIRLKPS